MHRVGRIFFAIGGLLVTALIVAAVFGFGYWGMRGGWGYMHPWMMPYYGRGFGTPFFMPIILVLFIALVIGLMFARRRRFMAYRHHWMAAGQPESAVEILKRRYAAGEIAKEEYEEKKKDIA